MARTSKPKQRQSLRQIPALDLKTVKLPELNTTALLGSLNELFDAVMSGTYNREQVRDATRAANSMMQVIRYNFDVFKYAQGRIENDKPAVTANR